MPARLISVGNVVVDIVVDVPRLPERGGDVIASRSAIVAGGAFTAMAAARRLGLPVVYAGAHGTGRFGDLARSSLAAEGIQLGLPPVAGEDTGWDVAMVDADGERTFVTTIGAEARLSARELAAVAVQPDDVVHLSGYGLLRDPNRRALVGWLASLPATVQVLYDPGPFGHEVEVTTRREVAARAHWWSGTGQEALRETGAGTVDDAIEALRRLWRNVLVRLGRHGCLVAAAAGPPVRVPGFAVAAVDTNGAGDVHAGAFLTAISEDQEPVVAARFANACAALAVTRRGPATGPARAEVEALLAR